MGDSEADAKRYGQLDATLPVLALSVRQPWAHAIIHLGKDIENRSWQAVNHGLRQRGRIAIHAAKGMTQDEYEGAADYMGMYGVKCPPASDLVRGAIIGSVEVIDVVTEHESIWFMGPRGLVLKDPTPCAPIPAVGALGYFRWTPADQSVMPAPARWMLPQVAKAKAVTVRASPADDLFSKG